MAKACRPFRGPLMNVWKMVKNTLAFFGTLPFVRIISGLIRAKASSGNAANDVKSLKAWSARLLRSARKRMRGRRLGSAPLFQSIKFQRALKSFHAIWNAMDVFPVPVASVRSMRSRPFAIASSTRSKRYLLIEANGPCTALIGSGNSSKAIRFASLQRDRSSLVR